MQKPGRIDFAKLLGFELVTRELLENFDLQEETIGAKLGAKVGASIEPTDSEKEGSRRPFLADAGGEAAPTGRPFLTLTDSH